MVDRRVIFAVAGSGKTRCIIDKLDASKRSLIITYTNNNYENIRLRIIKKFGFVPPNITLQTYFNFLHSFCYKPYLQDKFRTKGIAFDIKPNIYAKGIKQYTTEHNFLYSNRVAKLIIKEGVAENINRRLEKYYNNIFVDEVQDIAGNDFNLLKILFKANIAMLFVGDFFQHTYDTSADGNVNKKLFDDYEKYKREFSNHDLFVDSSSLSKSFRCSPSVCEFATSSLGISINSHNLTGTHVELISDSAMAERIIKSNDIVKLFFKEHYKYTCYSTNWGASKGTDHFHDVCVVLNRNTMKHFMSDSLNELQPSVKNKLYVACTRAKGNLYFIPETLVVASGLLSLTPKK